MADHGDFHGDYAGPGGDHADGDCAGPGGDYAGPGGGYAGPGGDHADGDYAGPGGDYAGPGGGEGTGRRLRLALPPDVPTVRLARQATRDTLAAWELGHLEEAALLLVSELVTNAVRHARDTGAIGLELSSVGTGLRVEVQDGDPNWRVRRSLADDHESGYGFVLVDSLAGRWGIRRISAGKAVWAELDA